MSGEIRIPEGDPVAAIWIWRNDSITLARLRPVLERIAVMAETPCFFQDLGNSCLEVDALRPCAACYCKTIINSIRI